MTMELRDGGRSVRQAAYAASRLAEVASQLEQAKLEALLGIHYDPDEYDHLVLAYRRARRDATATERPAVQPAAWAPCGPQLTPVGIEA